MNMTGECWKMHTVAAPMLKEEFIVAEPKPDEIVIEVAGCGVCHTDLGYFYDGVKPNHELPLTLGHEISGRVVACGDNKTDLMDKAVVVPAVIPCGECDLCRRGLGNICRSQKMPGNDVQGGFASHITVPAHGVCEVDEVLLDKADLKLSEISVLADAVTTPYQAVALADIRPGDLAIVIGVGGVGGYAVQIASAEGAAVVAVDVDQNKLEKLSHYGASLLLNAGELSNRELKKQISAYAKDHELRTTEWKIFECSGTAAGQGSAFSLLTHGAHLAVVGFTMDKSEIRVSNLMAFNARMQGNWGCLPEYYPEALKLVFDGKIKMKPFIKLHSLDNINNVFEAVHNHELSERAILIP